MEHYDYLIVGSGLYGATYAYRARQAGMRCLVIDKRNHVGGNVYCERVKGINVHKYGAHIFHTSDRNVWEFVNRLVPFNRYTNSPMACYKGRFYNLPFNMNTFSEMWGVTTPAEAQAIIEKQKAEAMNRMLAKGVTTPRNLEEQALVLVGNDIYEKLIKGYTEKQWGRRCADLPAFIIKRLPVRWVYDNNYFNDLYQGIPIGGYNVLIEKLLEGTEVRTQVDYLLERKKQGNSTFSVLGATFDKVVFTGMIDEYFDYRLGKLNYRTARFEHETLETPNYQGNAVINYTEATIPYTRIIEHKHFEQFGEEVYATPCTVVSKEYPVEWQMGMEPYYPVNDEPNTKLYACYKQLADKEENVVFGGRLAEYKYYDMDDVIAQVLNKKHL